MRKCRIELLFAVLALVFGVVFLVITPPFQIADEPAHYYRAYQVSQFEFVSQRIGNEVGGYVPKSILITAEAVSQNIARHPENKQDVDKIISLLGQPLDGANKEFVAFAGAVQYSPVVYVPQAIGIIIGQAFNGSPLVLLYLGRFMNLICWILICFMAIRMLPVDKKVWVLLLLMPMSIFQAASLSADAVTNALAVLATALALKYAYGKDKSLDQKALITLFAVFILLSLCKQVYIPMVLLFLLIPQSKIGTRLKYISVFISLFVFCVAASAIWMLVIKDLSAPIREGTSMMGQINYILSNPLGFLWIMAKSIAINAPRYVASCIGAIGWGGKIFPIPFYFAYFIAVMLFAAISDDGVIVGWQDKMKILVAIVSVVFLIELALYLTWMPVGAQIIEGVQGRYFIPITFMATLLLQNSKFKIKLFKYNYPLIVLCTLSLGLSVYMVLSRYYFV